MKKTENDPVWFAKGLNFTCTGCGKCCTGSPGYVWVTEKEIRSIASYLGIGLEEFVKKYVRKVGERFSLKEHAKTFDCVFLDGKKCNIYPERPKQCKTFPWWKENLSSQEAWQETAQRCEGIDHPESVTFSLKDIEASLKN